MLPVCLSAKEQRLIHPSPSAVRIAGLGEKTNKQKDRTGDNFPGKIMILLKSAASIFKRARSFPLTAIQRLLIQKPRQILFFIYSFYISWPVKYIPQILQELHAYEDCSRTTFKTPTLTSDNPVSPLCSKRLVVWVPDSPYAPFPLRGTR